MITWKKILKSLSGKKVGWFSPTAFSARRRAKSQLGQLRADLYDLKEGLDSDVRTTELRFVKIGRWFGLVIRSAQRFGLDSDSNFRSMAEAFNGSFCNNLPSRIRRVDHVLGIRRERAGNDLALLSDVAGLMTEVSRASRHTLRQSKVLRICAIGLSIESNVSKSCGGVLANFPSHVDDVALRIDEGLRNVVDDADQLRDLLREECQRLEQRFVGLRSLSATSASQNHSLPDRVAKLLSKVSVLITGGERSAQEIRSLASAGSSHLQFGDIVRGKCKYIVAALEEVTRPLPQGRDYAAGEFDFPALEKVLRAQCAQLAALSREVLDTTDKMEAIATGLAITLDEFNLGDEEVKQLFHDVTDDLEGLAARIASSRQASTDIERSAHRTSDAMRVMSGSRDKICGINDEMQLLAMNATVKATRLGNHGRAIEAWTDEISRLQKATDAMIEWLEQPLVSMEEKANSLQQSVRTTEADDEDLDTGIRNLKTLREDFKQTGIENLNGVLLLNAQIESRERYLNYLRQLATSIQTRYLQTRAVWQQVEPFAKAFLATHRARPEDSSTIARDAMESERVIHEQFQWPGPDSGRGCP
ncbi:MAG: hypothetical protein ACKVHO_23650 [Verrucomicrobiia bacterium]